MKLDRDELALRMLEAAVGFKRPKGMTPAEAFACGPKVLLESHRRAAAAACVYFIECAGPIMIVGTKATEPAVEHEHIKDTGNGIG